MARWKVLLDIGDDDSVEVDAPDAHAAIGRAFDDLISPDQKGKFIRARGAEETSPHFLLFGGGKYYLVQAKNEKQAWAITCTYAKANPQWQREVIAFRVKQKSWQQGNLFS